MSGQGKCLLCEIQPQLLLPPRLRLSGSLCSLLWPQVRRRSWGVADIILCLDTFSGPPSSPWTCSRVTARPCPTSSSSAARTSSPPPRTPSSNSGTWTRVTALDPSQVPQPSCFPFPEDSLYFPFPCRSREWEEFCWPSNWRRLHHVREWE